MGLKIITDFIDSCRPGPKTNPQRREVIIEPGTSRSKAWAALKKLAKNTGRDGRWASRLDIVRVKDRPNGLPPSEEIEAQGTVSGFTDTGEHMEVNTALGSLSSHTRVKLPGRKESGRILARPSSENLES